MSDRMPQSILVTGAAGFIGSRLARVLLERGDRVIGLDNLNDYYPLVHKRRNLADLLDFPQFTFVEKDLRDAEVMAQIIRQYQPQAVAHLAAMAAVRYSAKHPLIYGHVNVQGSMNLMDAARQFGKLPMVLASTGSTYGASTPVPFVETAPCNQPLAPYPASKRAMELMAYSFHHLYELPITILRFFNVYGPHGRPDMMPWQWTRMIQRGESLTLFDGGRLKRDWTYIDDIVAGFVAALDKPFGYEIINLGCSRPVENLQFVHTIERLLGKKATIVDVPCPPSEPPVTFADISKARTMLGYDPSITVEEGLARFIEWARRGNVLDD
jgi:UDP-glucuronate 4-epimerase